MSLQQEIDEGRKEIRTDGYPLSIGEWLSLYENNEIDIHPEFQRFFRWTQGQKTRLIESLLLGIPVPPIFVAQRGDGVWDVVDGLQRLSTIYQFVGILRDENNNLLPQLVLDGTKGLPSLKGKKWDSPDDIQNSFDQAQRLYIKRAKIGVSIILKESDEKSKYELFQRLNTGGTPLSDQEVRNSMMIMLNRNMYNWIRDLSRFEQFKDCIALTDRAIDEQYDMELALRFAIFRNIKEKELRDIGDISDFVTTKMTEISIDPDFDYNQEDAAFKYTFDLLSRTTKDNSFRKYDIRKQKFVGGFLISAFETVSLGIGYNFGQKEPSSEEIDNKIQSLWANDEFTNSSGAGVRASSRLPKLIRLGRSLFS